MTAAHVKREAAQFFIQTQIHLDREAFPVDYSPTGIRKVGAGHNFLNLANDLRPCAYRGGNKIVWNVVQAAHVDGKVLNKNVPAHCSSRSRASTPASGGSSASSSSS